jgi:glucosyl-3-phosphoglycerate synthase
VRSDVESWFRSRTSRAADWALLALAAAKADTGATVSVVLPALDEQETVGAIVTQIATALGAGAPADRRLVDELVVLDSGSRDRTAAVAAAAGATVVHRDDVLPRISAVPGKGEAMWRSLAATTGDLVVFIDADLLSFTPAYVTGLLGPLLTDPQTALVKAVYERPFINGEAVVHAGGGRVTELVARPLLNLHWPELAGVVQPLAGEYAARRSLLETLPFPCGYGVELGLLVDTLESVGLHAIAQVDLGVRRHRHHDEQRLGRMAADIMQTAYSRLAVEGRGSEQHTATYGLGTTLAQFQRVGDSFDLVEHEIGGLERPPMLTVPEYAAARCPQ